MSHFFTLLCFSCLLVLGCGRTNPTAQNRPESTPQTRSKPTTQNRPELTETLRSVILTSHLHGDLTSAPILKIGEHIQVVPDKGEPFFKHNPVDVILPSSTPYDGNGQIYFLRGYAVGQSSFANGQFFCHSNGSAARKYKSWNDGWSAGHEKRKQSLKN